MIRRRGPAATLIQSLWRCYAAHEGHTRDMQPHTTQCFFYCSQLIIRKYFHDVFVTNHFTPCQYSPLSPNVDGEAWLRSIATWKIHLQKAQRSPSSIKTNTSLLTRMSTRRRHKTNSRSPARELYKSKIKMSNLSSDNLSTSCEETINSNSHRNSESSILYKRNREERYSKRHRKSKVVLFQSD